LGCSGSYAAPGYVAAGLCFANALVAALWLPESRGSRDRTTSRFNLGAALTEVWASRQIKIILAGYLFITMAFSTLQPTLSLLASERFALGARQAGYLFAMLGFVSAVYQGGIVRVLVPRMGERRLFRYSTVPFAAGLLVIGLATDLRLLLAGLVLLGIGYGGAVPAVLGLLSRAASPERQGGVLGVGQSVGSLARVLGPIMAGALFDIRLAFPYMAGAALILLALLVSRGIAQPEGATR